jgi:acetyl-CoA carboxylase biotin carboxyl carrier protein
MDEKFYLSLVDKFEKSSITELEFTSDNTKMTLRKERRVPPTEAPADRVPAVAQYLRRSQASGAERITQSELERLLGMRQDAVAPSAPASAPAPVNAVERIVAPIVATFYASAGPDSPPFVAKGDKVKKGQTLCILEAMKMMNHLDAEFDMEILDIKAASGDLVEFGQVLFEVKKL